MSFYSGLNYSTRRPDGTFFGRRATTQPVQQQRQQVQQPYQQPQVNGQNLLNMIKKLGGTGPVKVDTMANQKLVDPYGWSKAAQDMRNKFMGASWGSFEAAQMAANQYLQASQSSFNNPYWNNALSELQTVSPTMQAANQALGRTLAGDNLSARPELLNAMRLIQGNAERGAEDQNAQIRAKMAQAGMGFSTADTQSQQASSAAQRSQAETTAATAIAENYARERQNQEQAASTAGQLQQVRNQQLGLGSDLIATRLGLLEKGASVAMTPVQGMAPAMSLMQGQAIGVDNIQRKTPMDWAMMLASLTPQASQALFGALRGNSNPQAGINWTQY
jgi:hypothetical protein